MSPNSVAPRFSLRFSCKTFLSFSILRLSDMLGALPFCHPRIHYRQRQWRLLSKLLTCQSQDKVIASHLVRTRSVGFDTVLLAMPRDARMIHVRYVIWPFSHCQLNLPGVNLILPGDAKNS